MNRPTRHERREYRIRATRIASIILDPTTSPIPCVVLDRSRGGFRLHVHLPAEVPEHFTLLLVSENKEYHCQSVWRSGKEMGVRLSN